MKPSRKLKLAIKKNIGNNSKFWLKSKMITIWNLYKGVGYKGTFESFLTKSEFIKFYT